MSAPLALGRDCPNADPAALAWMARVPDSVTHHSYQGVVMLQRGSDTQVMQVSRRIGQSASDETLTQLTGQGVHVKRAGHPLDCVHPGHQLLRLVGEIDRGHCEITAHYRFSVADNERVAGRKAVRIRIEPRDVYRYGYLLSLDSETGLILKTETLAADSRSLEKYQFANISYTAAGPVAPEAESIHVAHHPDPQSSNSAATSPVAWRVAWLPRGFVATDKAAGRSGRRTYTDGLAVFSVFLEDVDGELPLGEGVSRKGGTIAYTRGLRLEGLPLLATVIGEVPVNTARMVVDSIKWVQ
jgi:sigma-E factor negative regulatory protein RseB